MKAELLPLEGKYYGTRVKIVDDDGFEFVIELWNGGNYEPSDRELKGYCTIDEWRENKPISGVEWAGDGELIPARDIVEVCDGHFESRETHRLAQTIVERLSD